MHKNSKRYRDTWAAPGSQLFEALESGDSKRAAYIYEVCEKERELREGAMVVFMPPSPVQLEEIKKFGRIVTP